MKKILALTIVFALLAALCVPALADTQYAIVTTPTSDGTVYVRSAAGVDKSIEGVAKCGETLIVLQKGTTWHKVQVIRTGVTGYMYGAYVTFITNGDNGNSSKTQSSGSFGVLTGSSYKADPSVTDKDTAINRDGVVKSGDGYANMRWGAGLDYAVIGKVTSGKTVWVLEQNGDWYRCMYNEKVGYINKNLVTLGDTATLALNKTGVVRSSDGYANVRSGAGTDYSKLYEAKVGSKLTVYATSGSWFRVSSISSWYDEYVARNLLRFYHAAKTTGDVYVRKGPDKTYDKVSVLSKGTSVTLLATDGNFCRVDTGKAIAFVSCKYLEY